MRVPSDPAATPPPSSSGQPAGSESKSFDKVLERKTEDRRAQKGRDQKVRPEGEREGADTAAGTAAFVPMPSAAPLAVGKTAETQGPQQLGGLVNEIIVTAAHGIDPKVEMNFQSTTLDGLNVRISKTGDEISIRFLTGSDSVAQMLTQNASQLSQALAAKGLQVAPIRVEMTPASSRATDAGTQSRDGRRDGGDERQRNQR